MVNNDTERVFVGVRLIDEIARELSRIASELEAPGVRLVAAADLHLTLVAPWEEASLPRAIATMQAAVAGCPATELIIQHVGYAPDPRRPRFLWADCVPGARLAALRTALLSAFGQEDDRPFRPHVTLARIRHGGARIARNHPIDRSLSLVQPVTSVELFQSPRAGESGYRVLASAALQQNPHAAHDATL
jgi:2'-5' RNA ligase